MGCGVMTGEFDDGIEMVADLLATKWAAIFTRLKSNGFSQSEAMSLLRMYVLSNNIDVTVTYQEYEDES